MEREAEDEQCIERKDDPYFFYKVYAFGSYIFCQARLIYYLF